MSRDIHDPVCRDCHNVNTCKTPCPPVQWIDGNSARREPLLRDMTSDMDHEPLNARNYNTVIADVLRARRGHIDDIRRIGNIRIRAIAAMAHAWIPVRQIERLLHLRNGLATKLCAKSGTAPKS